jgi:hypothetical protein
MSSMSASDKIRERGFRFARDLAPDALPPGLDREQLLKSIGGHCLGPASL